MELVMILVRLLGEGLPSEERGESGGGRGIRRKIEGGRGTSLDIYLVLVAREIRWGDFRTFVYTLTARFWYSINVAVGLQ